MELFLDISAWVVIWAFGTIFFTALIIDRAGSSMKLDEAFGAVILIELCLCFLAGIIGIVLWAANRI